MKERLIAILGLKNEASEQDIIAAVEGLKRNELSRTANAEFEQKVQGIMHACHCDRLNALQVLKDQEAQIKMEQNRIDAAKAQNTRSPVVAATPAAGKAK